MKNRFSIPAVLLAFVFMSCHEEKNKSQNEMTLVNTPVTITRVNNAAVSEHVNLNATTAFLKKNIVKSTFAGYIERVFVTVGDYAEAGKTIFVIKTKEAAALSKLTNNDSLFAFKGEIAVTSPSSGTFIEIDRQLNDYISDGEQLAIIADQSSLVFLLNLPFELNKYASTGTTCTIILPDSTILQGTIASKLSAVDAVAQTQPCIIKPSSHAMLPESLTVVVQLNKSSKANAQMIEKTALLSDETMEHFWVMKLINDSTAVKVPVTKGIAMNGKVEILSPVFEATDRIVNTGNYGLPDTAFVTILNQ